MDNYSIVKTKMNAEMKSYTSGLAERIDIASEAVVQFFNCTIITAVIDRLAKEYHLDPIFWEFLSHKDDIFGYLMNEVKQLGYEIGSSSLADELMDQIYSEIDTTEGGDTT